MLKSIQFTQVIIEKRAIPLNDDLARQINEELRETYVGEGDFTETQHPVTANDLEAIWNEDWECSGEALFAFHQGYLVHADIIARDVIIRRLYEIDGEEINRRICTEHIDVIEECEFKEV